jgi:hypothetical protein
VLKVLVRYWKMSCNLDNLSCFSWSDSFAVVAVGLVGDRGESARLKVAAMGEVGCGLDSNSTTKFKTSIWRGELRGKELTRKGICNSHLPLFVFRGSAGQGARDVLSECRARRLKHFVHFRLFVWVSFQEVMKLCNALLVHRACRLARDMSDDLE